MYTVRVMYISNCMTVFIIHNIRYIMSTYHNVRACNSFIVDCKTYTSVSVILDFKSLTGVSKFMPI